ncbi:uncharacterized protein LOC130990871 [Salvia miltiorrhiza]|uniref:uncharacterized protein LOC130990871 n=1 Tax=Salvia miltiorrhiza TaxID=226208 RepID=UPI0025ACD43A|nr:uncharacterized protein LOC130990871 [Salvia miltiorrhiza]
MNLPLLNVIRNVPAYVKFFKELASKKRKFADDVKIVVSELASAILQHQLPPKQRDPGSFVIKIALGNGKETSGMLDLGAGINLMPFSLFEQLELGDPTPTRMCLQLADRSVCYPKGIVEYILVKVGGLIIPVDFVVLDVGDVRDNGKEHTLLLGRPFMETTNTLIDVKNGTLKMTVLGETVSFSVRDNSVIPATSLMENCSFVDVIDAAVEMVFLQENSLDIVLANLEALQLSELDELRNEVYDNAKIYKDKFINWYGSDGDGLRAHMLNLLGKGPNLDIE